MNLGTYSFTFWEISWL